LRSWERASCFRLGSRSTHHIPPRKHDATPLSPQAALKADGSSEQDIPVRGVVSGTPEQLTVTVGHGSRWGTLDEWHCDPVGDGGDG
jgi:hypothetical protein